MAARIGCFTFNDLRQYTTDDPQDVRVAVELDNSRLRAMAAQAMKNKGGVSRAGCLVVRVLNKRPSPKDRP